MKSDIELLIEHLRNEREFLRKEMEDSAHNGDYISAQYFFDILVRKSSQVKTLQELEPSNDLKIDQLKLQLKYLEKLNHKEKNEWHNDVTKKRLENIRKEIEKLQTQPKRNSIDSQTIDESLLELGSGQINKLRFHFNQKKNSYLDITFKATNQFVFSFTPIDQVKEIFWERSFSLKKLKQMGFQVNKDGNLESKFEVKSMPSITGAKQFLSRIIFDVLFEKRFTTEFSIEKF